MREEMEGDPGQAHRPTPEQIRKDIERDKILTAEEAKEYGLIDQVIASRKTQHRLTGSAPTGRLAGVGTRRA